MKMLGASVPDGWREVRLGDHVRIYSGVAPSSLVIDDAGVRPYVKVQDLNNNSKYQAASRTYTDAQIGSVPAGSVIFPKRGAAIMNNKVRIAAVSMAMDTNLMGLHGDSTIESEFLYYLIVGEGLSRIADTSTIPQINNKHINPYVVRVPPVAEQRRIAEILAAWDNAIDESERLLELRSSQFDVLRDKLFGRSEWEFCSLESVATRLRSISDGAAHPVMTISARSGFVLQSDRYNRDMAGANLAQYTLVRRGDFSYNKGNSLLYPQGCIFALKEPSALVPNVYFSFRLSEELSGGFYEHYFAAGNLNRQLERIISSGVRGNGLLNVAAADFFQCKIPVPPLDEQVAVAELLDDASLQLQLLRRRREALLLQKRALMRKLLSGEIRVEIEES